MSRIHANTEKTCMYGKAHLTISPMENHSDFLWGIFCLQIWFMEERWSYFK